MPTKKKTPIPPVPFRDILRYGTTGTQPVAVKRGLWNAGFRIDWDKITGDAITSEVFGEVAVENLKNFQRYNGLTPDGEYGPKSHAKLKGSFDLTCARLYNKQPPKPPAGTVEIPLHLSPPFHDTGGLPGFPANDLFGPPNAIVIVTFDCVVSRLSGKSPSLGGHPGGPYGWSTYLNVPHGIFYVTHQATRFVNLGEKLKAGARIGTVCDSAVSGKPGTSHVHVGFHAF